MKKRQIVLSKVIILLLTIGVFIWLIRIPQLEGRAKDLDLISIYTDPFIIYGYIASIPFFIGLYQTYLLITIIERNKIHHKSAVNALRNIKYSALSIIGFIAAALFYIRFLTHGDDPAGPIALGILLMIAAAAVAISTAVVQKRLQAGKSK
jgi:hypothetical protein